MSKEQGNTTPEIMPVPQSNEIHPRGLLDAISYIDQNFANELGGCMIKSRFLTTKQRLEFMEVGFRSSFASGIVSALLTPIAMVAGQRSEITEDQFVQLSQQGAAVISTRSGGGITGSVRADGGVKADYSSSEVVGTRVESRQNLAGSAASQEFKEGRSIDAGTAATTIAVGQGALHETAMTVGDVASVTAPNRTE